MNSFIKIDQYAESRGEGSASYIRSDQEYFAIIYEYIPSAKLELDTVQRQLDFFHYIGFHPCQGARERNWQGPGILLDFGDYSSPVDRWFNGRGAWDPCLSARVLVDRAKFDKEAIEECKRLEELEEQGLEPTEEEERLEEKECAQDDTAMYVEWGYKGYRGSYFDRKLQTHMPARVH
jgi:hypothetical protein